MFMRAALVSAMAAAVCACPLGSPPAEAVTETGLAVVSNQDASGSCTTAPTTAYDNHVVIATPSSGALYSPGGDLGKPASITGKLNDAKPFDNNRKIVAIWGHESATVLGGVGVYDRTAPGWTTYFPLPSDFGGGDGLAHSVAALPGGDVAVAQTGTIAGAGWGYVVVFRPGATGTATKKSQIALKGVHGVEWDSPRSSLFAVGDEYLKRYTYDATNGTLAERESWLLPTTGGHELRRRRANDDYFVTTNSQVYTFHPETAGAAAFTTYDPPGTATSLGGGWKSIDEPFTGTAVASYGKDVFNFADGTSHGATFCMKGYKVRWLYNAGDPTYREEQPTTSSATYAGEFLWEEKVISNGPTTAQSGEIWAGGAAGDSTAASAAAKVQKAITAGKRPYVEFYHWGDSGPKTMGHVTEASDAQFQTWNSYAAEMVKVVGSRAATFVVEPEWDSNVNAPCDDRYANALRTVVGTLQSAPNALVLNGVGLWKSDSAYLNCFVAKGLNKLFDAHGFTLHLLSNDPNCTLRDPAHPLYATEPHYSGGTTLANARSIAQHLGPDKITRTKRLFGGNTAYVTDSMITSCGWGTTGQAQIIQDVVDRLDDTPPTGVDPAQASLYSKYGFRGEVFRAGGPAPAERYTGVNNEGGLAYKTNPSAVAAINAGQTSMETYLAGSAPTDPPAFTSSATPSPANVAPGGSTTITVSVGNTKGSMSNANVDLEIYDSGGTRVGQKTWSGQTFANLENKSYTYAWTVPATAGAYRLKVGVFDSAWTSPATYWNDNAGTVTVGTADPAFTSSASATPSTVAPDGSSTISATVTNTGGALSGGEVTVGVRAPDGSLSAEQTFTAQSIAAGASQTYSMTWNAGTTAGTYTITVDVTGANGTPSYHTNGDAGSVTVSSAKFTSTASVSASSVRPGQTATISATVTNTGTDALTNGIVDVEVYDAETDTRVSQNSWSAQNILPGASASYSFTWTAPTTAGAYYVKVGVFGTGWTPTLHWNGRAANVTVAAPSFDITASAWPEKVQPGGPTTITVAATNNGGDLTNSIVDAEVYNSAGTRVAQKFWSGQTLAYGQTQTYSWSWTVPATLGTYTVKLGVFDSTWATTYKWNNNADSIVVANPTFTSAADVSSSTVAPGGTVTITATFTNTGASMTNGRADLEIYSGSTRLVQPNWGSQSIETGYSATYTYTWTAPVTPGTYTVKLGMFTNDWATTWHWNGAAATISVGSSSGGAAFQPSFRVGDGANTWWVEVYTSNDVTGVDVIGGDGRFYMSLTKKSWGAWAGTAPSQLQSGTDLVRFIARRSSDGATAGSNNFYWLTASPTTDPGWSSTFTVGSGASTTWVEVATSAAATGVEVKVGNGAFTALTYSATSGKWGKAMNVSAGSKVVFRATRADGARAYSTFVNWLQ